MSQDRSKKSNKLVQTLKNFDSQFSSLDKMAASQKVTQQRVIREFTNSREKESVKRSGQDIIASYSSLNDSEEEAMIKSKNLNEILLRD